MRMVAGLLVLALGIGPVLGSDPPPKPAPKALPARLSDADLEAAARKAMTGTEPGFRREVLARLKTHKFRTSKAPEKEYCTFAQGMLEAQFEGAVQGATTLKRLEKGWPKSPLLDQAQVVIATEALERKRYKEAETRLRHALELDLPPDQKRRAQEMLLWFLVEQNRAPEGMDIVRTLHPLGTLAPSEQGLAAVAIVLCTSQNRREAESAVKDFQKQFPKGKLLPKVRLALATLVGTTGDARACADQLRKIIRDYPKTTEADEARLALAMLLSEGKLANRYAKAYPDPGTLLRELQNVDPNSDLGRRRALVKLKFALREGQWREALDHSQAIRAAKPTPEEAEETTRLRAEAFRSFVREHLDKPQVGAILPFLDGENVGALAPETRKRLCEAFAKVGLPQVARTVADLAPEGEQAALRKATLDATEPGRHPEDTLALLPGTRPSALDQLRRCQAEAAKGNWEGVRAALPGAKPGTERIQILLAYLRRPAEKGSAPSRLKEAEAFLARSPEKGLEREPLVILVADLRSQLGDWRGALALYPEKPSPTTKGWVVLQRAMALIKLGRKEQAKSLLQAHVDEPAFKMERQTLGRQVGL